MVNREWELLHPESGPQIERRALDEPMTSGDRVLDRYTLDAIEHMEAQAASVKQPPGFPPMPGGPKYSNIEARMTVTGHETVQRTVDGVMKLERYEIEYSNKREAQGNFIEKSRTLIESRPTIALPAEPSGDATLDRPTGEDDDG